MPRLLVLLLTVFIPPATSNAADPSEEVREEGKDSFGSPDAIEARSIESDSRRV